MISRWRIYCRSNEPNIRVIGRRFNLISVTPLSINPPPITQPPPPEWGKKPEFRITPPNSNVDPVAGKYIATGLNRDAVPIAVAKYGDNQIKVREFVNGYTVLREMGFEDNSVAEALFTYDNDKEAAAHFLSSSS
ncbi:hypothetical protein L1987_35517 [Smallanthus sonchifolius]|uniref:Uncharacterized protein n=1 Tax=Smallanthus sonchifolius TaxID=185202 RepID=A0ACB9HXB6_9ASTR|nr:hypothetical protein L1987_35517 [Smallanthus sonchifolius]